MNIGIYCIENKLNGRKRIGQSKNLQSRINSSMRQPYGELKTDIGKYGKENFEIKAIFYCDAHELDFYERMFISQMNTLSPNGYNHEAGGTKGYTCNFTEKHRKNLSRALTGRKLSESHKSNLRKPKKEGTGQKISKIMKGKQHRLGYKDTEEQKEANRKRNTCPYCNKVAYGDSRRFHYKNCKMKEK